MFGRVSINKGMLVENIIAQQLRALGHSLFFYAWNQPSQTEGARPRRREVDFLLTRGFSAAAGKVRGCGRFPEPLTLLLMSK